MSGPGEIQIRFPFCVTERVESLIIGLMFLLAAASSFQKPEKSSGAPEERGLGVLRGAGSAATIAESSSRTAAMGFTPAPPAPPAPRKRALAAGTGRCRSRGPGPPAPAC